MKIFRLSFLVFFIGFIGLALQAQSSFPVALSITSADGSPIEKALIKAQKNNQIYTSNSRGELLINNLTLGSVLTINKKGFLSKTVEITQIPQTTISIILLKNFKDPESLSEVVVEAVRLKKNAPFTVSNMEATDIEERNHGQDIPYLIEHLPNTISTSDAGAGIGYTSLRIRGIGAQSTNVTINGIPYNDAESLGTFWVDLPDFASSVNSLQVQRGVGTSTHGVGAFGASINILTETYNDHAYAQINNSFGSFNTRKHTLGVATGNLLKNESSLDLTVRLSQIESNGLIDRASSKLKSYFLQSHYQTPIGQLKILAFGGRENTYQSWYGQDAATLSAINIDPALSKNRTYNIAGIQFDKSGNFEGFYENQVDNYSQDHYQFHWSSRISSKSSLLFSANYTFGRGYFEEFVDSFYYSQVLFAPDAQLNYLNLEELTFNGETITEMDYVRRKWLKNHFYVWSSLWHYNTQKTNLKIGGSFSHYRGQHFGKIIWAEHASSIPYNHEYYRGLGKKNDANIFAKWSQQLTPNWSVFADVQWRHLNYKTTGETSDLATLELNKPYDFFNPKLGMTYSANKNHLFYLSFALANREPSRSDFESNIHVKPEQLKDLELGWKWQHSKLNIQTNVYYMNYTNQLVLTGALDNVGAPIRNNAGDSYRLGLEIESSLKINHWLSANSNWGFSRNKNQNTIVSQDGEFAHLGETNLSYSPNLVSHQKLNFKPFKQLSAFLENKYVSKQYMGNTDSEVSVLPAYSFTNIGFTWDWKNSGIFKKLGLQLMINNIFNQKYSSNGYYYTYDDDFSNPGETTTIEGAGFYPQAGIHFYGGINLKF